MHALVVRAHTLHTGGVARVAPHDRPQLLAAHALDLARVRDLRDPHTHASAPAHLPPTAWVHGTDHLGDLAAELVGGAALGLLLAACACSVRLGALARLQGGFVLAHCCPRRLLCLSRRVRLPQGRCQHPHIGSMRPVHVSRAQTHAARWGAAAAALTAARPPSTSVPRRAGHGQPPSPQPVLVLVWARLQAQVQAQAQRQALAQGLGPALAGSQGLGLTGGRVAVP
jgi:hypothetical protein